MTWAVCTDPAIGYDLAHWQGVPSADEWAQAIALGVRWSISKNWHGASPVATAQPQLDGARSAGLTVLGRYAWLLPDAPLAAQVRAWCAVPRERDELPLTVDWEHPDTPLRGRALLSRLEWVVQAVADAVGELPIVYTGEWYMKGYCRDEDSEVVSRCALHLAAYPRKLASGTRYREAVAEVCGGVMPAVPILWRSRKIEPISWQLDGDGGLYLPAGPDGRKDVDVNVAAWSRLRAKISRPGSEPVPVGNDGPPNDSYYVDRLETEAERDTPVLPDGSSDEPSNVSSRRDPS